MEMKRLINMFFMVLPCVAFTQNDLSGLWQLKKRKSLSGPDYGNGIPKLIKIKQSTISIKIEVTSTIGGKDTVEEEVLNLDGSYQESYTPAVRKKISNIRWSDDRKLWSKDVSLSAKSDHSKPEIKIIETLQLSTTGDSLTFTKNYDGADVAGGNQDFSMEGVYEKTTPEKLMMETARGMGVRFVEGLNWSDILQKAKSEKKYIFIDCYATWCAPCKIMDAEVYPLNKVGDVLNDKFISIKVQMDSTKGDNQFVKLTYPIARQLENEYNIESLPTYLFFDSEGNIVHKESGAFSSDEFVGLIQDAADSSKQLYTLVRKASQNKLPAEKVAILANRLYERRERSLAFSVARGYFEQYLFFFKDKELFTQDNMIFLSRFRSVLKSTDNFFKSLLKDYSRFDSLSAIPGFGTSIANSVITKEEVAPLLKKAEDAGVAPDWLSIERGIQKKYGTGINGVRISLDAQVNWYLKRKEWKPYCEALKKQMDSLGDLRKVGWMRLNSAAWKIFEHSNDSTLLQKAVGWSEMSISNQLADTTVKDAPWSNLLDTYCNLLYKLGQKEQAIKCYQERVVNNLIHVPNEYHHETLRKMKEGLPTWPTPEINR